MSSKALRLFGEAFLRTLVIVLGLTIVFFAGFFLIRVATGGGNTNNQSKVENTMDEEQLQKQLDAENATADGADEAGDGAAEVSTEGSDVQAPAADSKALKIVVLNSTGTKGLAGAWVEKLKAEGYTNIYAGNYKVGQLAASKILAAAEGTGTDLVSYFNGAAIETGGLTSGFNLSDSAIPTDDIDLFIIIGTDDDIVQQ